MRTILVSSFAALLVSAPLAAQSKGKPFRTDGVIPSSQIPQTQRDSRSSRSKIPPGQLPPAGMCRIWIDGVPPGQQPAPTDCQTAVANRPANARVIWGDQQSFPGRGKGKFKTQDANQGTIINGQRRGHGDDDEDDDRDDDGRREARSQASRQIPVIGSIPSSSDRDFSKKGKKGKGHDKD
jgi:hypothetical protein